MKSPKAQVFLSHSGHDADIAIQIAKLIEVDLAKRGHTVEVFCTSEPEHRFKKFDDLFKNNGSSKKRLKRSVNKLEYLIWGKSLLKKYLRENINESLAFVSLSSTRGTDSLSEYINFELEVVKKMIPDYLISYFPLFLDKSGEYHLPEELQRICGLIIDIENPQNPWLPQLTDAISGIIVD